MTLGKSSALKTWLKRIGMALGILFIVAQFFQPDRKSPQSNAADHFYTVESPPAQLQEKMNGACMDCHSNDANYPWYSYITPLSFWIQDHINHGRKELNFSNWGQYSAKRQEHKLKEWVEEVEEDKMPLESYRIIHGEARLTEQEISEMLEWVKTRREEILARMAEQAAPESP